MEYNADYYNYNHWKSDSGKLTRTTYLSQYAEERRNKILKRFIGVTLKATKEERQVISGFLINCGYRKINDNSFTLEEHFIVRFLNRKKDDHYAMASIEFESNIPITDTIKVSKNIQIKMKNKTGAILFK